MSSRLYAPLRQPYYIWAPAFRYNSGGVRALHNLCHALNLKGEEAYVLTSVVSGSLRTPILTPDIVQGHYDTDRSPIAVYPEVISDNPLDAQNVVRYLLNYPGKLTGIPIDLAATDLVYTHGLAVVPEGWQADLLHMPLVDTKIFNSIGVDDKSRKGTAVFLHRYLENDGEPSPVTRDSIEISSRVKHRNAYELAQLLRSVELLYVYEPSTIIFEALLCGCPVVFLAESSHYPVSVMKDYGQAGIALGCDSEQIQAAKKSVHAYTEEYKAIEADFWSALEGFIEKTQSAAEGKIKRKLHFPSDRLGAIGSPLNSFVYKDEAEDNNSTDSWLLARQLSPTQEKLTKQYLLDSGSDQKLGVLVIDSFTSQAAINKTINSLADISDDFLNCECVVFGGQTVDASLLNIKHVLCSAEERVDTINDFVESSDFGWFMLVEAGSEFTRGGVATLAVELTKAQGYRAIYADEVHRYKDGSLGAALRPDFNLDYLLSFPAGMAKHWIFNREEFCAAGKFDPALEDAAELDYLLRLVQQGGFAGLGHIPEPLTISSTPLLHDNPNEIKAIERHLKDRGYESAKVTSSLPGRYHIYYNKEEKPLVSILIPTKNQLSMLRRCVESVLETTRYDNYEIIIIDNDSDEVDAKEWLSAIELLGDEKLKVLRYPHPFNYSAINNKAAEVAKGDYLLLLNNDTAIISESWLDELLNHALRPEVGIVGAKLLFPDKTVQHAGVILGLCGPAEHPFIGEPMDASGYMQRLEVDQNYSAVTAACLMIRKSVYQEVGGLDEQVFKVSYNDVDLCLKVRDSGYLIVWTPHSIVLHEGSVSQKSVDNLPVLKKQKRFVEEQDAMYAKWLPSLARDPAYNPNFSLVQPGGFKLTDPQISWRPLMSWRPLPVVLAHPADEFGCGNYRVIQPFSALHNAEMIDGTLSIGLMHVTDLERYDPDVIILQRQIQEDRLEAMRRMKAFSKAFKVYELDDYLPNVPLKSVHRQHVPKDVLKSLRIGLGYTDRFIVSTEALAEVFAGLHNDIRVVENRLPLHWWKGLQSERRVSKRPRIGWAGGSGHTGDLEMIADVIKHFSQKVDWIFFGMCPEKIKPYVKEVHHGVSLTEYPSTLASLNLDIALAPLEDNLFNECKSNLRLLEYGACGFPVICSDIRPYRNNLPATRVRNRFKDWVEAINMHLDDLDATARMGDELKNKVMCDWTLEGLNLENWHKAWMP